jgi:hypothetical protein
MAQEEPLRSVLDMTNGEVLLSGTPSVVLGLMMGYTYDIKAEALPDTASRVGVYRYTVKVYKQRAKVAEIKDTNFYSLIGWELAAEMDRLIKEDRNAGQVTPA